jgi:hypothetical protein
MSLSKPIHQEVGDITDDAYCMAMQIEENISLSKRKHIFSLGTKVDDPKGTPDTLSLERLISLDIFERRE